MFEFTYSDHELFESYVNCDKAYYGGEYDFTFEDRFIIYHIALKNQIRYIVIDKATGDSEIVTTVKPSEQFTEETVNQLIPYILETVKDNRQVDTVQEMVDNPIGMIDIIFNTVMPSYGYNIRKAQIDLAKTMYKGLTEKQVAICEAEVGTGKTLAYMVASLVARLVYKRKYGQDMPVTITTSSIELQKALVEQEIPKLSTMLMSFGIISKPLKAVLRKGKEHFLCSYRYKDYLTNILKYPDNNSRKIFALETKIKNDSDIDLDKITIPNAIKSRICVKGSCSGCSKRSLCRYVQYISDATEEVGIDFQVTNHNMYLASQKNRVPGKKGIIKDSCFVVIDEAHKLKEAAETTFGEVLCESDIPEYLNAVHTLCADKRKHQEYKYLIAMAHKTHNELFRYIKSSRRLSDADEDSYTVINVGKTLASLIDKMANTIVSIEDLKVRANYYLPITGKSLIAKLTAIKDDISNIVWINTDENNEMYICSVPRDITKQLKERVWDINVSYVLTSGTMSDGTDFEYFKEENGLSEIESRLVLESTTVSPFNYKENARLYAPLRMPFPDNKDEQYIEIISKEIYKIIEATNGHTAILFTSYRMLAMVYEKLADKLAKYELFKMTRGTNSVISDFKKSDNGILFASGSMWEGVDCVGDCLSSVIIVRLPFPIRSVLMEEKKNYCFDVKEFVNRYCTPNMLIKLRQGAGRLIRSETDTGVVSILDPRARALSYTGKVFKAMEKYPVIRNIEEVSEFMKSVKTEDYFT